MTSQIWIPKTSKKLNPLRVEQVGDMYECRRLDGTRGPSHAPEFFEHFFQPLFPEHVAATFTAACRRWYGSGHSAPASGARTAAYKALVEALGAEAVQEHQGLVMGELDRLEGEARGDD